MIWSAHWRLWTKIMIHYCRNICQNLIIKRAPTINLQFWRLIAQLLWTILLNFNAPNDGWTTPSSNDSNKAITHWSDYISFKSTNRIQIKMIHIEWMMLDYDRVDTKIANGVGLATDSPRITAAVVVLLMAVFRSAWRHHGSRKLFLSLIFRALSGIEVKLETLIIEHTHSSQLHHLVIQTLLYRVVRNWRSTTLEIVSLKAVEGNLNDEMFYTTNTTFAISSLNARAF